MIFIKTIINSISLDLLYILKSAIFKNKYRYFKDLKMGKFYCMVVWLTADIQD